MARKIVFDGANIAFFGVTDSNAKKADGNKIRVALEYFLKDKHEIYVVLSQIRMPGSNKSFMNLDWMDKYESNKMVHFIVIPSGTDDDAFVIDLASKMDGIIVSNDMYRDHIERLGEEDSSRFCGRSATHRLMFSVEEQFWPNPNFTFPREGKNKPEKMDGNLIKKKLVPWYRRIFKPKKIELIECPKCEKQLKISSNNTVFRCPNCKTKIDSNGKIIEELANVQEKTKSELQGILKERGLKISGNKDELLRRIKESEQTSIKENTKNQSKKKMRYFCPICSEEFAIWGHAVEHKRETGHCSYKCNECNAILPSKKSVDMHKEETNHSDISGDYYGQQAMRIKENDLVNPLLFLEIKKEIEQMYPERNWRDVVEEKCGISKSESPSEIIKQKDSIIKKLTSQQLDEKPAPKKKPINSVEKFELDTWIDKNWQGKQSYNQLRDEILAHEEKRNGERSLKDILKEDFDIPKNWTIAKKSSHWNEVKNQAQEAKKEETKKQQTNNSEKQSQQLEEKPTPAISTKKIPNDEDKLKFMNAIMDLIIDEEISVMVLGNKIRRMQDANGWEKVGTKAFLKHYGFSSNFGLLNALLFCFEDRITVTGDKNEQQIKIENHSS